MSNHVHLILLPSTRRLARRTRRCPQAVHPLCEFPRTLPWHLWRERFHSFAVDETYLLTAVRYVELNPVAAHMVKRADEYQWSSTRAHLAGKDDKRVKVSPMLARVSDWRAYLDYGLDDAMKKPSNYVGESAGHLAMHRFLINLRK